MAIIDRATKFSRSSTRTLPIRGNHGGDGEASVAVRRKMIDGGTKEKKNKIKMNEGDRSEGDGSIAKK